MPTIGPTPHLRRELDRLIEYGADLPDVDWDTLPAQEIARIVYRVKTNYTDRKQDRIRATRRRLWRTGDGVAGPGPRVTRD